MIPRARITSACATSAAAPSTFTTGKGAATISARSRARGDLVQKSRDAPDAAVLQHGEIRALDRAVDALGTKAPTEADMVAVAVGLADQLELEIGKALLHACDQRIDAVMAVALHQGIDIARIRRPVLAQQFASAAGCTLVPEIDVAAGDGDGVGHCRLLRWRRVVRLT